MKRTAVYILAAVFAAFFVWLFSYTMDPKLDLNGDNAIYIQLARNMAGGHGYSSLDTDGVYSPASHFPPGYSAILSVAISCGVTSLLGFKILNGVFLFLSLCGLVYLLSRLTRQLYMAFAIAMLVLLCPVLMHFAGIVMSEMSYMLCTVVTLVALYRYAASADGKAAGNVATPPPTHQSLGFLRSPWFYVAVVFAVASYHIRTVGASAMAAVVIFYLFRKEWAASAGSVVAMAMLMVPWAARNAVHGIKGRYLDTVMVVNPWRPEEGNISSFGEFFNKMLANLDETVIKGFKEILFPFMTIDYQQTSSFMAVIGGLLLVALIFYGAWNLGSMRWAVMAFVAANIGLFALWHGGNGSRYVTPVAPLLFFCFYTGVYAAVRRILKNRIPADSPWLAVLLLMALPMVPPIQEQHRSAKRPYPIQYRQYFEMAEQLNTRAAEGSVVSCRKPELFGFYAPNLRTTRYLYSNDPKAVVDDLYRRNADYVVIEQLGYSSTPRYLVPAIQAYGQYFPVIWHLQNPDAWLLRFDRAAYRAAFAGDEGGAAPE
ncbi:MAG: ArnT family glycosyltransferase [Candidatus Aphodosoma sp.]